MVVIDVAGKKYCVDADVANEAATQWHKELNVVTNKIIAEQIALHNRVGVEIKD